MGITDDFCQLLKDSGCDYLNLSVESGSERMLQCMQRGYTVEDVRQSLACLEKAGIPFGASLMIGAPGETPETVAESLALIDSFTIPLGTWVTVGICLWTPRQEVLAIARQAGQLTDDRRLFERPIISRQNCPRSYMIRLIETLGRRKVSVQVNQPYAGINGIK